MLHAITVGNAITAVGRLRATDAIPTISLIYSIRDDATMKSVSDAMAKRDQSSLSPVMPPDFAMRRSYIVLAHSCAISSCMTPAGHPLRLVKTLPLIT
jgi:hypothetical protein